MIYLHKVLPALLLPTGVTLILLVTGLWLRRPAFIIAALALLWVASTALVGQALVRALERGVDRRSADSAPVADAIVVLSSGRVIAPGAAAISEWGDADRFFGGLQLLKANKAPLLVFTGGGTIGRPGATTEGEILAGHAKELGIPAVRIAITHRVLNTAEEAVAVRALLQGRPTAGALQTRAPRVLLVTSAYHMPRAARLFRRNGLDVLPFPVDFQASRDNPGILALLPSASALSQSEFAIREMYGRLFYLIFD